MVGGILVLFIYITRIASNEKFSLSINFYTLRTIIAISTLISLFIENYLKWINLSNTDIKRISLYTTFETALTKYFTSSSRIIILILITYLLIALIAVVKITNIAYGPLRKIN